MRMKLQNKEMMSVYYGLQTLVNDKTIKLPARVAYAIIKNIKTLEKSVQAVEETRQALLQQNGELDLSAPGIAYKIPPDKIDYVNKELNDLGSIENEINLSMIKFSDIEDKELSVSQMDALYPMIENGEG